MANQQNPFLGSKNLADQMGRVTPGMRPCATDHECQYAKQNQHGIYEIPENWDPKNPGTPNDGDGGPEPSDDSNDGAERDPSGD